MGRNGELSATNAIICSRAILHNTDLDSADFKRLACLCGDEVERDRWCIHCVSITFSGLLCEWERIGNTKTAKGTAVEERKLFIVV